MPSPQRDCQTTVTSLPTTPHKAQGSPPKQGTHVKPQHGNPRVREAGGHTARRHPPCRQNATGGRAKQHTHRPPPPRETDTDPTRQTGHRSQSATRPQATAARGHRKRTPPAKQGAGHDRATHPQATTAPGDRHRPHPPNGAQVTECNTPTGHCRPGTQEKGPTCETGRRPRQSNTPTGHHRLGKLTRTPPANNRTGATTEQHTHRPPPPWEADNDPPCQQQGPGHTKLTQRPELPREKNTRPAKQGTGEQTLSTERSESKVGQRAARCQESGQASAMSSRVCTECCTSNAASARAASTCMAAWGPHAENHSAKWSAAHGVPESPRMVP